jgi:hypothetical protein
MAIVLTSVGSDDALTMSSTSFLGSAIRTVLLATIASMPVLACVGEDPNASPGTNGNDAGIVTGQTLDCRQKAGADTDSECESHEGKPRKLDCNGTAQTDEAIAAGCVRTAEGSDDVCCPTTIKGTSSTSAGTTTVSCRQKAGADADSDCADQSGKPRKLDCSSAADTDEAIAAGCVRESAGSSDVCCPTTVSGKTEDTTPTGQAQAIWELSLGGSPDCTSLPTLTFGSFSPPTPVKNGETVGGSTASVVCSVKTAQSGFSVSALASMTGGASVQVVGSLAASSPPGTLTGTFIFSDGTTFTRSGCTATYPPSGGIAAGRVWAKLECPAEVGVSTLPGKCVALGQVRFENCSQ